MCFKRIILGAICRKGEDRSRREQLGGCSAHPGKIKKMMVAWTGVVAEEVDGMIRFLIYFVNNAILDRGL